MGRALSHRPTPAASATDGGRGAGSDDSFVHSGGGVGNVVELHSAFARPADGFVRERRVEAAAVQRALHGVDRLALRDERERDTPRAPARELDRRRVLARDPFLVTDLHEPPKASVPPAGPNYIITEASSSLSATTSYTYRMPPNS